MAVLTRLKNFVSLLRSGSKSNEEEKEDVELNATPMQGQVILNEEQVALEQAAKEAEEQKEMTVEEQLESLKITHQFPYKAVKKIVKERDMDYFRDLYSTEEAIKRTDLRGNQVATAVAGTSMAAYMGIVAASAVAMPAVVMGLIGFGIGGGIVYAVNKLTGKESAFGSLFRKLKVRFGKIKPTVNVKQYRKEFNEKKFEVNKVIDEKTKVYKNNVIAQEEVDKRFDDHIMKTARGEETTFSYEDEDSQNVLDSAANSMKEAIELNEKMVDEQNKLVANIKETTTFITNMLNSKADVESKQAQSNKEFADLINTIAIKDVEDVKVAITEYEEVYSSLQAKKSSLDADKEAEVAKFNRTIESIDKLPNKDDAKYVAAKEKAQSEIAEIDAKYAELQNAAQAEADAKIAEIKNNSVIFNSVFDEIVDACNNGVETSDDKVVSIINNYVVNKIDAELDSVSLDANIGPYVDGQDSTVIITSPLDVNYDAIAHKVASILGQDYPESDAEVAKVIADFEDRNADIAENLQINFDLNIEEAQENERNYKKGLEAVEDSIKNLDEAIKSNLSEARNLLKQKRAIITQASAQDALDTATSLHNDFDVFEKNQQEQLQQDLKNTTPGMLDAETDLVQE